MLVYSQYALMAALGVTALAAFAYIWAVVLGHQQVTARAASRVRVGVGADAELFDDLDQPVEPAPAGRHTGPSAAVVAKYANWLTWLAFACLTTNLVLRAIVTGRGPFVTQHEFAVSMAWGFLLMFLFFEWRYRARTLALIVMPMALGVEVYALTWSATADPLVPALQNSLLLTLHIIVAIVAYGAFAVSAAAAVLYLVVTQWPHKVGHLLPKPEVLDRLSYRGAVIGYPLLTMVIVLGAFWAEIAWGRYWSWDPKETISLVQWLVYGGFLHARVARGWVGKRSAWLLLVAFAMVILTFFGNAIFGGLHSYGVV